MHKQSAFIGFYRSLQCYRHEAHFRGIPQLGPSSRSSYVLPRELQLK